MQDTHFTPTEGVMTVDKLMGSENQAIITVNKIAKHFNPDQEALVEAIRCSEPENKGKWRVTITPLAENVKKALSALIPPSSEMGSVMTPVGTGHSINNT